MGALAGIRGRWRGRVTAGPGQSRVVSGSENCARMVQRLALYVGASAYTAPDSGSAAPQIQSGAGRSAIDPDAEAVAGPRRAT